MATIICPNTKSKEFLDLVAKVARVKPMSNETATAFAKILFVKNEGEITDEIIRHEVNNGGIKRSGLSPSRVATKDERKTTMTLLKEISIQSGLGKFSNVIFTAVKSEVPMFRASAVVASKLSEKNRTSIVVNTNSFTSGSTMLETGHLLLENYMLKNKDAYLNAKKELQNDSDFKSIYGYKLKDEVKLEKPEGLKGKFDPYSKESKDRAFNRAVIDLLKHEGSMVLTGEKTSNKPLLEFKSGIDKELQSVLKKLGVEGAENITSDITIGRLTNELKNKNGEASFSSQASGWKSLEKRLKKEDPKGSIKTTFTESEKGGGVVIFFESKEDAMSASFSFPNNVINLVEQKLDEHNTAYVLQVHKPLGEISEPTHEILGYDSYPQRNPDTGKYSIVDSDKNPESDKEYVSTTNAVRSVTGSVIPNAGSMAWKVSNTVSRLFGKKYYSPDSIDNALKSSFTDEANYNKFHSQMEAFFDKYTQSGWSIDKGGVNVVDRGNGLMGRSSLIVTEKGADGLPIKKLIKFEIYKDSDISLGTPTGYKISKGEMKAPFLGTAKSQETYHELELGLQAHLLTNSGEVIHEIEVVPISIDMTSEGDINNAEIHSPINVFHDSRTQENIMKLLEHRSMIGEAVKEQVNKEIKANPDMAKEHIDQATKSYNAILNEIGVDDVSKVTIGDLNTLLKQHGNNESTVLSNLKFNKEDIAGMSMFELLHHSGNNTRLDADTYFTNEQNKLSIGGAHVIKKVNADGTPVREGRKLVDEPVSGSKYAESFGRDYIKVTKIMKEVENELSQDENLKGMSNLEKINSLFTDYDKMIKLMGKLEVLNPDATKFITDKIKKGAFVQELFKQFKKEHSKYYTQARLATCLIGEVIGSENGSFRIEDFDTQVGGLTKFFILDQYIDDNKNLMQFLNDKHNEAKHRIDEHVSITESDLSYFRGKSSKYNDKGEKVKDNAPDKNVFKHIKEWTDVDKKTGNLIFKNPEDIDAKKYPKSLEFVNYYLDLKSQMSPEASDLRVVPSMASDKSIDELAGGFLSSKVYDHINIAVEQVGDNGNKETVVKRLGDLKKDAISNVDHKDLKKDNSWKEKFNGYDKLAKEVYNKGKGTVDFAGKNVVFDQRGRKTSNLKNYGEKTRNENVERAVEAHLKELVVKREIDKLLPLAYTIKDLYVGDNAKLPLAKHAASYIETKIKHELLGQSVDFEIPYLTKWLKGMIKTSYITNLLWRPALWIKHGTARALNLLVSRPIAYVQMARSVFTNEVWTKDLITNIRTDYNILHNYNKGIGKFFDAEDMSFRQYFTKFENAGHIGYKVVDTVLHGIMMKSVIDGLRPERGQGLAEIRKAYDVKGNPLRNEDGSIKFPDLVLQDHEIQQMNESIDAIFGAYGDSKMQYSFYTVGRVAMQYTGAWAIPQLMKMFSKRVINNGQAKVGYVTDLGQNAYELVRKLRGQDYKFTDTISKSIMSVGIQTALTYAAVQFATGYKRDIDELGTIKDEDLTPEERNEKHSAQVKLAYLTLGLSELLSLVIYSQGLIPGREKDAGKVGGAYSVLAGERAASSLSVLSFIINEVKDSKHYMFGEDVAIKPTKSQGIITGEKFYSLEGFTLDRKFISNIINEIGIAKEIREWYREGENIPFIGALGEDKVAMEKAYLHFAKGANLEAISENINKFVERNNIDLSSRKGQYELMEYIKNNKVSFEIIRYEAERKYLIDVFGNEAFSLKRYKEIKGGENNIRTKSEDLSKRIEKIHGMNNKVKKQIVEGLYGSLSELENTLDTQSKTNTETQENNNFEDNEYKYGK